MLGWGGKLVGSKWLYKQWLRAVKQGAPGGGVDLEVMSAGYLLDLDRAPVDARQDLVLQHLRGGSGGGGRALVE